MLSLLISSTFNDMQAERDAIRALVAPALRKTAARYGQSVRLIDLRWGVNTAKMDEAEAAQKVLNVCLDEIDRCDGYMICLLGNRYGWVPDYEKLTAVEDHGIHMPQPVSVTELEIQYGILQRNRGEKSVIFLRDQVTGLPEEMYARYNDPAGDGRMAQLKEKLEALPETKCHHYSLQYREDGEFDGIRAFADRLIRETEALLHRVYGAQETEGETLKKKRAFEHLMEEQLETYLPHPVLEKTYDDFEKSAASMLVLRGEEGMGKTAFAAHLTRKKSAGTVLPYFAGENASAAEMALYLMNSITGEEKEITSFPDHGALMDAFHECLQHVEKPLLFVIDGMDQFAGEESRFSFLPHDLPENVRFVLTTSPQDEGCSQLGESFPVMDVQMPPVPDAAAFVRACLAAAGKALPEEILQHIAAHPLSGNYLFLDMMVRMLMLLGRHDFAVMGGGGIDGINAYILDKINHLPKTMLEMGFLFLYDLGDQVISGRGADYLSAMAQAPHGLRAQDLQHMYPENWDEAEFAFFVDFLEGFLSCDEMGCYQLTSLLMRRACIAAEEEGLLARLCDHFAFLPDNDPVKVKSALPLFLLCGKAENARQLMLHNRENKGLYRQLFRMLPHAREGVSSLLNRDDVLFSFLEWGYDASREEGEVRRMAALLSFRPLPEEDALAEKFLTVLSGMQLFGGEKDAAAKTLSRLLALPLSSLARAEHTIRWAACAFVEEEGDEKRIQQRLEDALSFLSQQEMLPEKTRFLYHQGQFFRIVLALWDAVGFSVTRTISYADFLKGKRSGSSAHSYLETLVFMHFPSMAGFCLDEEMEKVMAQLCDFLEQLLPFLCIENEQQQEYSRLFFDLMQLMDHVDCPASPFRGAVPPGAEKALDLFRKRKSSLTEEAYHQMKNALHGRYNAPMLKTLSFLQIQLAGETENNGQKREYLQNAVRVLWRYFSMDPLPPFAQKLADACSGLADACLAEKDEKEHLEALEKWYMVNVALDREKMKLARDACRRYPDEVHREALEGARRSLQSHGEEYGKRLWLGELYTLYRHIDTMLVLYRQNTRRGIKMKLPDEIINVQCALVFVKKKLELEEKINKGGLAPADEKRLRMAYHAVLVMALEVVLLSEKEVAENHQSALQRPEHYYTMAANFVESYIKRCRTYQLEMERETQLQLSFCLARLRVEEAACLGEKKPDALWDAEMLAEMLMEKMPEKPIPGGWLMDEVNRDGVMRLQCRVYLMQAENMHRKNDAAGEAACYLKGALLCRRLYFSPSATALQQEMCVQYALGIVSPMARACKEAGLEDELENVSLLISDVLKKFQ